MPSCRGCTTRSAKPGLRSTAFHAPMLPLAARSMGLSWSAGREGVCPLHLGLRTRRVTFSLPPLALLDSGQGAESGGPPKFDGRKNKPLLHAQHVTDHCDTMRRSLSIGCSSNGRALASMREAVGSIPSSSSFFAAAAAYWLVRCPLVRCALPFFCRVALSAGQTPPAVSLICLRHDPPLTTATTCPQLRPSPRRLLSAPAAMARHLARFGNVVWAALLLHEAFT